MAAKKKAKIIYVTNEMLKAAFDFRDAELWKALDDGDVFGFKTTKGDTAYCCVMGNKGTHFSLGVYLGDKGFSTYLGLVHADGQPYLVVNEISMDFDCINIDFEDADSDETFMTDDTRDLIMDFAKENNIDIGGEHAIPAFTRVRPSKIPSELGNNEDAELSEEAMDAALEVARKIKDGKSLNELGFIHDDFYPPLEGGKKIPLLMPTKDGEYEWTTTITPQVHVPEVQHSDYLDDDRLDELDKIKKKGVWQCQVAHFYTPLMESSDGVPYFPIGLFAYNKTSDRGLQPVMLGEEDADDPIKMLDSFADYMIKNRTVPMTIEVADTRTLGLLDDFCVQEDIHLNFVRQIPQLDHFRTYINQVMQQAPKGDDPRYN